MYNLPETTESVDKLERLVRGEKDALGSDFHKHLVAVLRQKTRWVLSQYTDEAVASLTGYDYLLEAGSALSS